MFDRSYQRAWRAMWECVGTIGRGGGGFYAHSLRCSLLEAGSNPVHTKALNTEAKGGEPVKPFSEVELKRKVAGATESLAEGELGAP